MVKKYTIGANRSVSVRKQDGDFVITIAEDSTNKSATFTAKRWNQFVKVIDQVDESLKETLKNQYVKLNLHVGGKWNVSVTTGFKCVDIRQFYFNPTIQEPKPTKKGIALRLDEWNTLKAVVPQIYQTFPAIQQASTCSSQPDHYNQEGAWMCPECSPYAMEEVFYSMTS